MAKFPTYDAPPLEIRPTETGIDAIQQAARRTGAFYGQAAEDYVGAGHRLGSAIQLASNVVQRFQEHREISAGAKNFAQMQDDLTTAWNHTINAPGVDANDPAVAAKFRENVLEPALDKFANQGFLTEK